MTVFVLIIYQIGLLYCKFHLFCTYEGKEYKKGNKVTYGQFTSAKVAVAFSHWFNECSDWFNIFTIK